MDNASKALVMAGEILIGIMVVGISVYAISNFGKFSANMNEQIAQNSQIEFNNNFLRYERRIDITADEIVSVINFARNNNDSYELFLENGYDNIKSSAYFVDVKITANLSGQPLSGSFFQRCN